MKDGLKIAKDLVLPLEAVTSTIVAYGGKGMGKTNLGSVLVEELTRCGLRWAWLDPLGVSWGLRHSADGSGPGIECLILGGPKGDVPIEPDGGAAVADVVIEEPHNILIDFSRKPSGEMWSVGERVRFVTAYALRLFQRQGELVDGHRREPLFQMLDEAARYIPQVIPAGNPELARCVGAWEQLCEEGRNIGLGVGLLTQRSARMNKSVSELADAMFAFRTVGPNSLDAILDWLGQHVEKARLKDLADKVRALERGHALVVSPGWLRFEGVVKVRMRETFDSSATPKAGERQRKVRGAGARPDLDAIRTRMSATIEKAKGEDPKLLRAENAKLRAELAKKVPVSAVQNQGPTKADLNAEYKRGREEGFEAGRSAAAGKLLVGAERVQRALRTMYGAGVDAQSALEEHIAAARAVRDDAAVVAPRAPERHASIATAARASAPKPARQNVQRAEGVSGPQQRILDALAWLESVGVARADRVRAAMLADQSPRSSGFEKNISTLKTAGLIDYPAPGFVILTDSGRAAANGPERPPTVEELRESIRRKVSGPQWALLAALIDRYPEDYTREQVAEKANASAASSGFEKNISTLRSLGFIDYPAPGKVVALPVLFLE
jgi:hypothetical protein